MSRGQPEVFLKPKLKGQSTEDLESLSHPLFLPGTYLPTINLIVFVQTPFRARAKDTATKQNQQTEE